MKVSVIIPFYNAQDSIAFCLEALADQNDPPDEIILVDNRSSDKSSEIASNFKQKRPDLNFKLVEEPTPGPSAARNRGIKEANGAVIAFTDSDCVPDRNWLTEVQDAFTNSEIGAVAGKIIGFKPEAIIDRFHAMFTMQGLSQSQVFSEFTLVRGGFPTANLAIRQDVLKHIGGFNESMKIYSEDYDLCARIYEAGFSILYSPEAIVYHKHRNTLKETWKQNFGFGTGHAALLRKHFKRMLIIDLPRYGYKTSDLPIRAWIDLAGADKKLLLLTVLSSVWWPFIGLLVLYLFSLYQNMGSRLQQNEFNAKFLEKLRLIFLLFFKSTAITLGRLIGSFQNNVVCF